MRHDYQIQYLAITREILRQDSLRETRNANTKSIFAPTLRITELRRGRFPLLNGRKLYYKGVLGELAALLRSPKHVLDFEQWGCNYWGQWADEEGNLELDYGNAWTDFNGVNQLQQVIDGLKNDPYGRRHIIIAWRPDRLPYLSLPCCHTLYQFYVGSDGALNLYWYQRSADWMVGVPSDVILAAAWLLDMCAITGYEPGDIHMSFIDAHIYEPHISNAMELVVRQSDSLNEDIMDTTATFVHKKHADLFEPRDIEIVGYAPLDPLKFEVLA